MKTEIIEDTKIVEGHINGALKRILIFTIGKSKYKISIRQEGYERQSFANLSKWIDSIGWKLIIGREPKRDYGINVSAYGKYKQTDFDPIIKELTELAIKFEVG